MHPACGLESPLDRPPLTRKVSRLPSLEMIMERRPVLVDCYLDHTGRRRGSRGVLQKHAQGGRRTARPEVLVTTAQLCVAKRRSHSTGVSELVAPGDRTAKGHTNRC